MNWRSIKPGWYLLLALLLYSIVVTTALSRSNRLVRALRVQEVTEPEEPEPQQSAEVAPEGLWFPIPGATLPQDEAYLPGAPRVYRRGESQGFDFYSGDAGIPIPYGAPVIAAADAVVTRADRDYEEPSLDAWQTLLNEVAEGDVSEEQLNRLRGRQVWLQLEDGRTLRYAHLSEVAEGLAVGDRVYRGQVVGYVGNSGTDDGVADTRRGARLHFEVWDDEGFLGQDMSEAQVRQAANALFVGP